MRASKTQSIKTLGDQFLENHLEENRVKTGFTNFDNKANGLGVGLYVIASRPAMGKTAFILSMALQMCREEKTTVMICSLEMNSAQLYNRIVQVETEIQNAKFLNHSCRLNEYNLFINDENNINVETLLSNIEQQLITTDVSVVFIDYIQLVIGAEGQRVHDNTLHCLNQFAEKHSISIVITSQLPRMVDKSATKIPMLRHLDSIGNFTKYARGVGFLYRPEYYGFLSDENGVSNAGIGELHYDAENDTKIEFKFKNRIIKFNSLS